MIICTPRVKKAMSVAMICHENAKHGEFPYAVHCIETMFVLIEHGISDEVSLCSAAMHDIVEDCGKSYDYICNIFGHEIASIVCELTDDIRVTRKEQLKLQISNVDNKSYIALSIKLADRIANLRRSPGETSPSDNRLEHSAKLLEAAKNRREQLVQQMNTPIDSLIETLSKIIEKYNKLTCY